MGYISVKLLKLLVNKLGIIIMLNKTETIIKLTILKTFNILKNYIKFIS
jgi:hypothetical protein